LWLRIIDFRRIFPFPQIPTAIIAEFVARWCKLPAGNTDNGQLCAAFIAKSCTAGIFILAFGAFHDILPVLFPNFSKNTGKTGAV
jgi:hypothetical protein